MLQQGCNPTWQLPLQTPFQLDLYSSPVIISQTFFVYIQYLFVAQVFDNYIPFNVCLLCVSYCHFKGLWIWAQDPTQFSTDLFCKQRSETWQVLHKVTGWWILKKWDNMWGQQLSLFRVISMLCLVVCHSAKWPFHHLCMWAEGTVSSSVYKSVTIGGCLCGSVSLGLFHTSFVLMLQKADGLATSGQLA